MQIIIATPAHNGNVSANYAISLAHSMQLCKKKDIQLLPIIMPGNALIQAARNDLIAIAYKVDVDAMIWIDSDQEFTPDSLLKLIENEFDVVGYPVVKKNDIESYNIKADINNIEIINNIIKVQSIGTGYLKLSRRAIKYLWGTSDKYIEFNEDKRSVFEVLVKDGALISEDVNMCLKLLKGGFDINLDISYTCSHIGIKKWDGDFAKFLERIKVVK